jgi:hypothetical protein
VEALKGGGGSHRLEDKQMRSVRKDPYDAYPETLG